MANRFFKTVCTILIVIVACRQADAIDPCDGISKIKKLPFKGEKIDDSAYNALIEAGEAAIPCLIKRITDTTKMRDPRQSPTYANVRVGDIAYFVLLDISKIDFVEMLPAGVQEKFKAEGVYAYFEFVERNQNRKWLQSRLQEWYRKKQN